jgi:hypothetical protein
MAGKFGCPDKTKNEKMAKPGRVSTWFIPGTGAAILVVMEFKMMLIEVVPFKV